MATGGLTVTSRVGNSGKHTGSQLSWINFIESTSKTLLKEKDLEKVYSECCHQAANWENIGLHLGLTNNQLERIAANKRNVENCLRAMLSDWLRGKYMRKSKRYHEPSWWSLCKAIQPEDYQSATTIAKSHQDNVQTSTDDEIAVKPSRNTSYDYDCGCGKCTVKDLEEKPCPRPKQHRQSAVHPISSSAKKLSGEQLEAQVQSTEKIIKKFRINLYNTVTAIEDADIRIDRLRTFIYIHLDDKDKAKFPDEASYEQITKFLSNVYSWYRFDLIEDMANQFVPRDFSHVWSEYRRELKEYAHSCTGRTYADENVFVMEMDEKYHDINIKEEIPKLRETFAKSLGIDRTTLHFTTVVEHTREAIFLSPDTMTTPSLITQHEQLRISSVKYQSASSFSAMELFEETDDSINEKNDRKLEIILQEPETKKTPPQDELSAEELQNQLDNELDTLSASVNSNWKISYKKLLFTDEAVGKGAYGEVKVALFNGERVAVKIMYSVVISTHHLSMLSREINIMAQLDHPNLLRFKGAVFDHPSYASNPMIITELMDTSLRKAYEEKQLTPDQQPVILSIMRDVAVGLNYLHCLPDPIIHRDVSSANVLLESKGPGNKMSAKLSDFGSANIAQSAMTPIPGAYIYTAPELVRSLLSTSNTLQTSKIDVYSYGVLLCEALNCMFPEHEKFRSMLEKVCSANREYHSLIISCIEPNPQQRPTMEHILQQLLQN